MNINIIKNMIEINAVSSERSGKNEQKKDYWILKNTISNDEFLKTVVESLITSILREDKNVIEDLEYVIVCYMQINHSILIDKYTIGYYVSKNADELRSICEKLTTQIIKRNY